MTEQGRILPRNGEHKNTCSKIKPNQTKHMQLQTQWIRKCAGTFFLGGNTGRGRVTHHGKSAMTHSFICMSSKKGMEPNHPSKNCHAFFSKKTSRHLQKHVPGRSCHIPPISRLIQLAKTFADDQTDQVWREGLGIDAVSLSPGWGIGYVAARGHPRVPCKDTTNVFCL